MSTDAVLQPSYAPYAERIARTSPMIGVESDNDKPDFGSVIKALNHESATGYSDAEINMLDLVLTGDYDNKRFDNEPFIDPAFGGNTGEHPLFLTMQADRMADLAGYEPAASRIDEQELQTARRMIRELQGMIKVHDMCELVDISYGEMLQVGASKKEPEEEGLVGPYKLLVAAYALSSRQPNLYHQVVGQVRSQLKKEKRALYKQACEEIEALTGLSADEYAARKTDIGNAFVAQFGKKIAACLEESQQQLEEEHGALLDTLRPEYREAYDKMGARITRAEEKADFLGKMCDVLDAYEGSAHMRHFVGEPNPRFPASDSWLDKRFNGGRSLNFDLAASSRVVKASMYGESRLPALFEAAQALPPGPERKVAMKLSRAATGMHLRNVIQLLQKAPPIIDLTGNDTQAAALTDDPAKQESEFRRRLETQRGLVEPLRAAHADNFDAEKGCFTKISGVVDTKTLIAVYHKLALAVESEAYVPAKGDLPLAQGELPEVARVTKADVYEAMKRYPMRVKTAYEGASLDGQAVRL